MTEGKTEELEKKEFSCLHCKLPIVVTEEYLQKKINCPHCTNIVKVPSFLKYISENELLPINVISDSPSSTSPNTVSQEFLSEDEDEYETGSGGFFSLRNKVIFSVLAVLALCFVVAKTLLFSTVNEVSLANNVEKKLLASLSQSQHWQDLQKHPELKNKIICDVKVIFDPLRAEKDSDGNYVTRDSGGVRAYYNFSYKNKNFFEGIAYESYPGSIRTNNPLKKTAAGLISVMKNEAAKDLLEDEIGDDFEDIIAQFIAIEEVGTKTNLREHEANINQIIRRKNACVLENFPERRIPDALSAISHQNGADVLWPILFSKYSGNELIRNFVFEQLRNDQQIKFFWVKAFQYYRNLPELKEIFVDRIIKSDQHSEIITIRFNHAGAVEELFTIIQSKDFPDDAIDRVIKGVFANRTTPRVLQYVLNGDEKLFDILSPKRRFLSYVSSFIHTGHKHNEKKIFRGFTESLDNKIIKERFNKCVIGTLNYSWRTSYSSIMEWYRKPKVEPELGEAFMQASAPKHKANESFIYYQSLLNDLAQRLPSKKWDQHDSLAHFSNLATHGLGEVIDENGVIVTATTNHSILEAPSSVKVWLIESGEKKQVTFNHYKILEQRSKFPYIKVQVLLKEGQKTIPSHSTSKAKSQFAYVLSSDGNGGFHQNRVLYYRDCVDEPKPYFNAILARTSKDQSVLEKYIFQSSLIVGEDGGIFGFFDMNPVFTSERLFSDDPEVTYNYEFLTKYKGPTRIIKNSKFKERYISGQTRLKVGWCFTQEHYLHLITLASMCNYNNKPELSKALLKAIAVHHLKVKEPCNLVFPEYLLELYKKYELHNELITLAKHQVKLKNNDHYAVKVIFEDLLKFNKQEECRILLNKALKGFSKDQYKTLDLYGKYALHFDARKEFRSKLAKKRYRSDANDALELKYGWPQGSDEKLQLLSDVISRNLITGIEERKFYLNAIEGLKNEYNFRGDTVSANFIHNALLIEKNKIKGRKSDTLIGDFFTRIYSFMYKKYPYRLCSVEKGYHIAHVLEKFKKDYQYAHSKHQNLHAELTKIMKDTKYKYIGDSYAVDEKFLALYGLYGYALQNVKTLDKGVQVHYRKEKEKILQEFIREYGISPEEPTSNIAKTP